jgi:hypothetical protein
MTPKPETAEAFAQTLTIKFGLPVARIDELFDLITDRDELIRAEGREAVKLEALRQGNALSDMLQAAQQRIASLESQLATARERALKEAVAAIEALDIVQGRKNEYENGQQRGLDTALDAVEALLTSPPPRVDGWIPVTPETMPPHGRTVLAFGYVTPYGYNLERSQPERAVAFKFEDEATFRVGLDRMRALFWIPILGEPELPAPPSQPTAGTPRLCPGCRALDGEHDFGPTCTLVGEPDDAPLTFTDANGRPCALVVDVYNGDVAGHYAQLPDLIAALTPRGYAVVPVLGTEPDRYYVRGSHEMTPDERELLGLDRDDDSRWCLLERSEPPALVGSDGGEPEDQLLVRGWRWVAPALNRAHLAGSASRQPEIDRLEAQLLQMESAEVAIRETAFREAVEIVESKGRHAALVELCAIAALPPPPAESELADTKAEIDELSHAELVSLRSVLSENWAEGVTVRGVIDDEGDGHCACGPTISHADADDELALANDQARLLRALPALFDTIDELRASERAAQERVNSIAQQVADALGYEEGDPTPPFEQMFADLCAHRKLWSEKDGNTPGYNLEKARAYGAKAAEWKERATTAEAELARVRAERDEEREFHATQASEQHRFYLDVVKRNVGWRDEARSKLAELTAVARGDALTSLIDAAEALVSWDWQRLLIDDPDSETAVSDAALLERRLPAAKRALESLAGEKP